MKKNGKYIAIAKIALGFKVNLADNNKKRISAWKIAYAKPSHAKKDKIKIPAKSGVFQKSLPFNFNGSNLPLYEA